MRVWAVFVGFHTCPQDVSVVLMIKALVGARTSSAYHVFELEMELPKYAMYAHVERGEVPEPSGRVTCVVAHPAQRLAMWVENR